MPMLEHILKEAAAAAAALNLREKCAAAPERTYSLRNHTTRTAITPRGHHKQTVRTSVRAFISSCCEEPGPMLPTYETLAAAAAAAAAALSTFTFERISKLELYPSQTPSCHKKHEATLHSYERRVFFPIFFQILVYQVLNKKK